MLVLLKSYSEISVELQLELSGKLLVILNVEAILLFSGYKKVQHSIVGVFCLGKNVSVLRNLNFCPKKIHSWTKNYVSLNLLSILL